MLKIVFSKYSKACEDIEANITWATDLKLQIYTQRRSLKLLSLSFRKLFWRICRRLNRLLLREQGKIQG